MTKRLSKYMVMGKADRPELMKVDLGLRYIKLILTVSNMMLGGFIGYSVGRIIRP